MATNGTIRLYPDDYLYTFRYEWEVTATDPYLAQSTITWRVYFNAGSNGKFTDKYATGSITFDSVKQQWSAYITTDGTIGKDYLLHTGTFTIQHNPDGTKNDMYWLAIVAYNGGSDSETGTVSLPTITRWATISSITPSSWNDETNPTIQYTNPSGSSVTSLQICIKRGSTVIADYRDMNKDGYAYTLTLTDTERSRLRAQYTTTSTTLSFTFTVRTIIGGTQFTNSVSKNCNLINAWPLLSPTVVDTNPTTKALTGDDNTLIKYHSRASYTMNAQARKGATIKQLIATNGSVTHTTETGVFEGVEAEEFEFSVKDSRGATFQYPVTKAFVHYIPLTAQLGIGLLTGSGTIEFNLQGKYFKGKFGTHTKAKTNSFIVSYATRDADTPESTGDTWKTATATSPSVDDNNNYTYSYVVQGLDSTKQYTLKIRVSDSLTSHELSVPIQAIPVFDWGKTDFRFNVPVYMKDVPLDYVVEQYQTPVYYIDSSNNQVEASSHNNWKVRKWSSGLVECWCNIVISTKVATAWGGLYTSGRLDTTNLLLPVTFVGVPTTSVTMAASYVGGLIMSTGSSSIPVSSTSTGTYEIARGSSGGTNSYYYTLHYNVKGYWQ